MTKFLKIVDDTTRLKQNYFKIVFFRSEEVKELVPLLRWSWLCFVELLFGEELLESFVTTSSNSGCPEEPDPEREYGEPIQLNLHIPSGILTGLFRDQLLQVLFYKFHLQYKFIMPVAKIHDLNGTDTIDVSRIRFRLRKSLLYLVIAFRRVYLILTLTIEIMGGLLTWWLTTNAWYGVIMGIALEGLRRILRI